MLRATVRASESSAVEPLISDLQARCESARLSPQNTAMVVAQIEALLSSLVERGQELAARGSQMIVTREISGDGYSVKLIFRAGDRRNAIQRLLDAIRGR